MAHVDQLLQIYLKHLPLWGLRLTLGLHRFSPVSKALCNAFKGILDQQMPLFIRFYKGFAGISGSTTNTFVQIVAIGAEVTAVAIYCSLWFPAVPQWIWVVCVSAGLIAINAMQVGHFGEFEYWFAIIKVIAIVAFILLGLALIFGFGPMRAVGFSNLTAHSGFLPHGIKGVWLAMTLTLTSYMGVEILGVTAGEAEQPEKTIPRAMLSITPWDRMGSGVTGSPFVFAFSAAGVPFAGSIMNLVVITAALSSANTNLYLTTRTLFSLSCDGYVGEPLGRLAGNGVPYFALFASTGGMVAAILLAILLYGVAVAGMFFVWMVILAAHLAFRRVLGPERVGLLPIRLPFSPGMQIIAATALAALAISTFYVEGLQFSVPSFLPFLLLITAFYIGRKRKNRSKA
jgi:L-asparagine transporter-like permease